MDYTNVRQALLDLIEELDYAVQSIDNEIEVDQLIDELEGQSGTIDTILIGLRKQLGE